MNTNTVVSLPVAADLGGKEHEAVKLTSTGVAIAGVSDRIIGTLLRAQTKREDGGSAVGMACSVFLTVSNGFHWAKIGNDTALAMGDELERDTTSGRLVKKVSGLAVAICLDAVPATSDGGITRVLFLPTGANGIEPVTLTQDTLTDNTTGTASTTLASISDAATKNAIASLAAQLAKVKVDIAAINAALGA